MMPLINEDKESEVPDAWMQQLDSVIQGSLENSGFFYDGDGYFYVGECGNIDVTDEVYKLAERIMENIFTIVNQEDEYKSNKNLIKLQ